MITLPISPEYRLAQSLIDLLCADVDLAPIVLDRPLDRREQVDQLTLAAEAWQGAVAVMPDATRAPWAGDVSTPGRLPLEVDLSVLILTTPEMTEITADDYARRIRARVIAHAQRWDGEAAGIPYSSPRITALDEVVLDVDGLAHLMARSVTVTCRVVYTLPIITP